MNEVINKTFKKVRKLVVGVIGFTVLLIGIVMIVLPGPAFIVIPVALAILATEFVWARILMKKIKQQIKGNKNKG
jgi:uncharacterized protein (TIGR02611 family)